MGKYVLVGICLLAFVAGGVAQLALRRPSEKSGVEENVVKTSGDAAPEVSEKAGGQAAQTGYDTEAPRAEGQAANTEAAVEPTDVGDSGEESSDQTVVNAGEDRRVPPRRAKRNAYRAVGPRARAARPTPPPAGRQARTTYARSDDGLHHKTAKGVKKTGKWLGRGLKKVGDVFHD